MTSLIDTISALTETNACQAERILQLEAALRSSEPLWMLCCGLTVLEIAMLQVLLRFDWASHDQLLLGMYGHGEEGRDRYNIRPLLSHLRRKLVSHGVTIETVWGVGYMLPAASKAKLRAIMGAVT